MREHVVCRQLKSFREAVLHLHGHAVVNGTIVAAKEGKSGIFVAPVLMHALLALVTHGQPPIILESVLVGGAGHQSVRRVVIRIDQRGRAGAVREIEFIDRGERIHPTVLRQVVVIHSDAGAQNRG